MKQIANKKGRAIGLSNYAAVNLLYHGHHELHKSREQSFIDISRKVEYYWGSSLKIQKVLARLRSFINKAATSHNAYC